MLNKQGEINKMRSSTISTIKLIPESRSHESQPGQFATGLLAFGPDMVGTYELGRVVQAELEGEGVIYEHSPDRSSLPNVYSAGSSFMDARQAKQKVEAGEWSGDNIAANLLKGMNWVRIRGEQEPLDTEKVRRVGQAISAAYNAQYGLWGERDSFAARNKIFLEGQDRMLIRGSTSDVDGFNGASAVIDARSERKARMPSSSEGLQRQTHNPGISRKARVFSGKVAAAAASLHL